MSLDLNHLKVIFKYSIKNYLQIQDNNLSSFIAFWVLMLVVDFMANITTFAVVSEAHRRPSFGFETNAEIPD